jgi:ferric-dicitrate binding protein FerR (iron transport regulator)
MKLSLDRPKDCNAIAKYIAGEMSPSEVGAFEAMVNSHPDNYALLEIMKKDWKQIGNTKVKTPNVDKAWQNLQAKLESETAYSQQLSTVPLYKQGWVQWAAAVAVILIVGSVYLTTALTGSITIRSSSDSSTLVHTLADGSVVYLVANSTLRYDKRFGKSDREIYLKGEAFFEVTPNANQPFEVETQNAKVKVLGTSFTVKAIENTDFEVVVETGTVNVSAKADKVSEVIAQAGDRITFVNNRLTKSVGLIDPAKKILNQRFQFKDEQLASIVSVINKTYGVNIVIGTPGMETRTLTVTFLNNSVPSMVEVICATLGLESEFEANTITLRQPADGSE